MPRSLNEIKAPVGRDYSIRSLMLRLTRKKEAMTENWKCEHCGGEGWVPFEFDERGFIKNMRPCACQVTARVERCIPAKYRAATLADFNAPNIEAVGDWIGHGQGLGHGQSHGLFLYGPTGVGKTHLAMAICRRLIESGQEVLVRSATDFYREVRNSFNEERSESSVMREYASARWLLLDDIGSGNLGDFERRYLLDLLDHRASANLRTIVTSNLSAEDFAERLDERIGSRLHEFTTLLCKGADRRAQRGRTKAAAA
jgi:Cdc6-like AAA superfamily ATPase